MEILAAYGEQCLIFHILSNHGRTILQKGCIWQVWRLQMTNSYMELRMADDPAVVYFLRKIETENGDFLCYHTIEKRDGQEFVCIEKGL